MVEKEIKIKISTETDISSLDELDERLDEIASKGDVDVVVDADSSSVEEATDKTTELEDELGNVDGTVVTPEVDTSSIDDAKEKLDDTSSSMDNLTTAAAGLAATAGFEQMAVTADNINTSWNRLDLTFQGTGVAMDTLKEKATSAGEATGRSGGVIRDYFNQMGIAGVTNANLLESSFEALSGKAYQTNQSIESMEGRLQRMVMTGNASGMSLQRLGIDAQDLANAMGVSADQVSEAFKNMTPEERLQAITKAMGDGAKANEMYKDSYQGLKDQAQAAMAGLMGAVGQAILPVVVPALRAATTFVKMLTDGFKDLPAPVQAVIGGIGGAVAVFTALVGVVGIAGQVIGGLKSGIEVIRELSAVRKVMTAINTALAASEWATLGPILLIVAAVVALIAVLGYLYFNNEQVRAAIDGLGQTLQWVAGIIYDSLIGTFEWLSSLFTDFTSQIGLNTSDWKQAVLGFILFLPQLPLRVGQLLLDTVARALGFGDNFTSTMVNGAVNAVNGFVNWITSLPGKLWAELQKMLDMASNFAMEIADKLTFGGASMVAGWLSGSGEHSPGFMYDALIQELMAMLNAPEMLSELVTGIGDKGYEMANALSEAILGVDIDTAILGWIQTFGGLQDYMLSLGGLLPQSVDITGNKIIDTLIRVVGFIATLPVQIGMYFTNMIAQALGFGNNFSQRMFSAGANAVSNFARSISNLSSGLVNELNDMISDALNFAGRIGQILWDAGINAITNFLNALDRHSPGIMQREFVAEISEMGARVPVEGKRLVSNMGRLGSDVVDSFQPELDGVGFANNSTGSGGVGQVNNFYFSDIVVDDDKRMQRIVEYITRELDFDNATAGRTN